MLKIFRFFFIFSFFFLIINCQKNNNKFSSYDINVWNAMLEYKKDNPQKALDKFQKAFEIIPNESTADYFYAVASALKLKKDTVAKNLLIKSILKTNASEDYFDNFKEFDSFRDNPILIETKKNYNIYRSMFYKNLDYPQIYKEIDSLVEADQEVRFLDSSDKEKIRVVDSTNILRLIDITKKYGWQSRAWLLLWHQRGSYEEKNYVWDFFKPYIDEQIKKGEIRKDFWALFEEEQSITKNKVQIYGLYTSQYETFPITDIKNVDKRRKKLGMPPLWYLREVYEIQPPEGYPNNSKNSFD